jgi:beta-galactosidase
VPDAANKIHFELDGPGKILGVGNGDPSSHEPDVFLPTGNSATDWQRSLFSGLAQIIVQSTKEPGEIKLTARADGLTPVTLAIPSQPTTPRPAVAAR